MTKYHEATKALTPKQSAKILSSLRDQRLDVRLGILTEAEWKKRVAAAVDIGVPIPAEWKAV